MRADVVAAAVDAVHPEGDPRPLIYLSPRGRPLTQQRVRELASGPGVALLCGRFEGLDERVIEARQMEEVSLGDFVLSGGEPAALALLDAVIRLLPGVMGKEASGEDESFEGGLRKTAEWYLQNRDWWERVRSGLYRGERLGLIDAD